MTRRLWTFLATLAALLALAQPAVADDGDQGNGGDNVVVAENRKDGSSLFRFAFDIKRIAGDVVDTTNAAVAYSSCTDCKTTAIAIQILLVEGSPSTYTPQNYAVAVNENCSGCQTFASAYQFVVQSSGPVRFTRAGWKQLKEIRKAIRDLEDKDLSPAELDATLQKLMAQLQDVLEDEIVPADQEGEEHRQRGPPDKHRDSQTVTTPTTSAPTTTSPPTTTAPTTTAEPAATTAPATTTTTPSSSTTTTTPSTGSTTTTPTTTTTNATTTTTP